MVVDQFARAHQVRGVLAVQDHDQSDDAGPFAIAHAVRVLENSQAPELVRNFKKLGLEDALAVFAKANATRGNNSDLYCGTRLSAPSSRRIPIRRKPAKSARQSADEGVSDD